MWNHYYNYTTCIESNNLNTLKKEITCLVEEKLGGNRIAKLPLSTLYLQEQEQDTLNQSSEFWFVELFEGTNGWTVVKTYPYNLLCFQIEERGSFTPLLSALTVKLQCNAFHIDVYDSIFGILLETNSAGRVYVSGTFNAEFSGDSFYKQPINSPELIEQFSLLDVDSALQSAIKINDNPKVSQKKAEYQQLIEEKNPADFDLILALENEVFQGHTERIDRAFKKELNNSDYWHSYNLLNRVRSMKEELAEKKTYLFYFQSPPNFKLLQPYTLTKDQWLEIYGIEPPFEH